MPEPELPIDISEFSFHDVLSTIVQGLADKYGVEYTHVEIVWQDGEVQSVALTSQKAMGAGQIE